MGKDIAAHPIFKTFPQVTQSPKSASIETDYRVWRVT